MKVSPQKNDIINSMFVLITLYSEELCWKMCLQRKETSTDLVYFYRYRYKLKSNNKVCFYRSRNLPKRETRGKYKKLEANSQ